MRIFKEVLILLFGVSLPSLVFAQNYAGGVHRVGAPQGQLLITSGSVNNFNANTFNVYGFMFYPSGSDGWQQIPIIKKNEQSQEFCLLTQATADFFIRDAKVSVKQGSVYLHVAQKLFKETPYDQDAFVEVRRFKLLKNEEKNRWQFVEESNSKLGVGKTVEQALELESR